MSYRIVFDFENWARITESVEQLNNHQLIELINSLSVELRVRLDKGLLIDNQL